MGLIRVSDAAEEKLKRMAAESGRTVTSTVDVLVEGNGGVDTSYFDKKFEELLSAINDTAVDRLATGGGRAPGEKEWVKWEQMQYIIFNREDDDPAWVIPEGAVFSFKNGDPNELAYYIKNGTIYIDGPQPVAILKVTPDIREAIDKHFTFND